MTFSKNLLQPIFNKLANGGRQAVAKTLQGCDDLSGKETTAWRCCLRDWLRFDDSEDQDNAEWEQDKEREAGDVSEGNGEQDEYDEGVDGTIFARITEEVKDASCKSFGEFPTLADDITEGEIEGLIFLQNIQMMFNKQSIITLTP